MEADACWGCGSWTCKCDRSVSQESLDRYAREQQDYHDYLNRPRTTGTKTCPGRYGYACSTVIDADEGCCENCKH